MISQGQRTSGKGGNSAASQCLLLRFNFSRNTITIRTSSTCPFDVSISPNEVSNLRLKIPRIHFKMKSKHTYRLLHWSQGKGRSPLWYLTCCCMFTFWVKVFPHRSHWNRRPNRCTVMCVLRPLRVSNLQPPTTTDILHLTLF